MVDLLARPLSATNPVPCRSGSATNKVCDAGRVVLRSRRFFGEEGYWASTDGLGTRRGRPVILGNPTLAGGRRE